MRNSGKEILFQEGGKWDISNCILNDTETVYGAYKKGGTLLWKATEPKTGSFIRTLFPVENTALFELKYIYRIILLVLCNNFVKSIDKFKQS
jgi:hypothetical protein